ncbi:phenazine biosynthesis protein-like protein phzf family [Calycina marina]|uniref:Phenazine biosynthesis protein-like protein phzf family n=1 Tax=Calycina marina TaxID=1763456 RepID=A0A9P8CGA1_9HELO|nr:phenazine biosynthesis protein-like protein phzf family [Calycina marina]
MRFEFTTIDAFTTTRYNGNPLAIVRVPASDKSSLCKELKLKIASEFNLSEIVFMHLPATGESFKEVAIDIFTHEAEVPFAGHPIIGTSHYLLNELGEKTEAVITKAGRIPITKDEQTGEVKAVISQDFHIHKTLAKASRNLNVVMLGAGDTYNLSLLDDGWQVGLVGTMYVASQGTDKYGRKSYRTRMFGSREDPGTGSACSGLGCYLATLEPKEAGKGPFLYSFTQGVKMGRQSDIAVEVIRGEGGEDIDKVLLGGAGVKVMDGVLEV